MLSLVCIDTFQSTYTTKRIESKRIQNNILRPSFWFPDYIIDIYIELLNKRLIAEKRFDVVCLNTEMTRTLRSLWDIENDDPLPILVDPTTTITKPAKRRRFRRIINDFRLNRHVRMILVPCHLIAHWVLYVFDLEGQRVMYYDSTNPESPEYESLNRMAYFKPMTDLIEADTKEGAKGEEEEEEEDEKEVESAQNVKHVVQPIKTQIRFPDGPFQSNGNDCGPLTLLTMQCLIWNRDVVPHLETFTQMRKYIATNIYHQTIKKLPTLPVE